MDTTSEQQWIIPEGTEVIAADGDKVGKVVEAQKDYLVVEKGWLFPTDYYVPRNAINTYDGDKVYLAVTKDEAVNQSWESVPAGAYGAATVDDRLIGTEPASSATATGETVRVPVHEEELTATKRTVERGTVRVDKDVVAEQRTLDVPVTEERLVVNRRVVDRDAPAGAEPFKEDRLEIPLLSEEVDVQKRNRVVEEIEIGKERVPRTEHVIDTVRREEVHVDTAGATTGAVATGIATTGTPMTGAATPTRWTPAAAADYDLLTGKDVYSAEGDKVGTIKGTYHPAGNFAAGLGRHYFLLDPGMLRDWFGGYDQVYLPESAIAAVTSERVDLTLSKDQVKGQNWTTRPADLDTYRWA